MHILIGLGIALFIALTGVGAGTVTVPVLVLFLGIPAPQAVAIGLTFSAIVKLILTPAQIAGGNVHWRTLGRMLLGGLPGVLLGSLLLSRLVRLEWQHTINGLLGAILFVTAAWQVVHSLRKTPPPEQRRERTGLLAWLMLPVGAEVGFSSAGAGALGSAALLSLTRLSARQVVGTDIAFGFLLSLIGSGAHMFSLPLNNPLLMELAIGGLAGAVLGTALGSRIPRRPLRLALSLWLMILGGQLLVTSYTARAEPVPGRTQLQQAAANSAAHR